MITYNTLSEAMDALKLSLNQFSDTMQEVRSSLRNDSELRARRTAAANLIMWRNGFAEESLIKLEQWGVYDAQTDDAAEAIIYEVIEYRRDANLHHCE